VALAEHRIEPKAQADTRVNDQVSADEHGSGSMGEDRLLGSDVAASAARDPQRKRPEIHSWVLRPSEALIFLSMWIVTHAYLGVIHDARLYTIQALNSLEPGRFAEDLFLKYGSQDKFTLFTTAYKPLVAAAGPWAANLLATIAGDLLWLVGLGFLMRTLFARRREFLFASAAVILLQAGYGGDGIFRYGEPFATPRLYAEALAMIALGFALRGRPALSALFLISSTALHPLMALGGAGVIVVFAALHDRRVWILVGLAAGAGVLLALAGVDPFGRALIQFDDAWFRVVLHRCDYAFLGRWHGGDFSRVVVVFSVFAVAYRLGESRERRLLIALAIVALAGLLATFIGCDVLHNVLIVDLQPWRALWLASVLANAFVAIVAIRLPEKSLCKILLAVAAAASAASVFIFAFVPLAPPLMIIACTAVMIELHRKSPLSGAMRPIVLGGSAMVAGLGLVGVYWSSSHQLHFPLVALGAGIEIVAVALLVMAVRRRGRRVITLASCVILPMAIASAGQVEAWQTYVFAPSRDDGLRAFVAGSGRLYWEGDSGLKLLWFKLGVPEYFSCVQSAGVMFYRGTAEDYSRRGNALRLLNSRDFEDQQGGFCLEKSVPLAHGPQSRKQVATVCRLLPDLDTLVLNQAVPGASARVWRAPAFAEYEQLDATKVSTFYRYSCADFR
jgi:hypothetical protein